MHCAGFDDSAIPEPRRALLALLRADGHAPLIVETFIKPMLRTLAVPTGKDGPTYVLQIRDQAAAAGDISAEALDAACKRFEVERTQYLPWIKDVIPALQAAQAALNITLQPSDPRWAAWIAYDKKQPSKAQYASWVERQRRPYVVRHAWPPESCGVERASA